MLLDDTLRTKTQLIEELTLLRQRQAEWETTERERQQLEQAQQESQRLISRLADAVPDLFYVYDLTDDLIAHRNLYTNRQMEVLLGYDLERVQALGTEFFAEVLHPDDFTHILSDLCRRFAEADDESIIETEYRLRHADGSWRWFLSRDVVLTRDGTGMPRQILGTAQDITARKNIEDRLRQVDKMGALGVLAGGIAHEFNNILAGLLGFTQLLHHEIAPDSSAGTYVEQVRLAGLRAKDLVQQIIAFSRQEPDTRKAILLETVVKDTLSLLRVSLPITITLETHLSTPGAGVYANQTQLVQVLMNLCINASYIMREAGGHLTISTTRIEVDSALSAGQLSLPPGSYSCLTVSDTGGGIPADVIEHIFDPFFTTKPIGEGTGMGLAIVYSIIASHGGVITVASPPGAGTTFSIYLPQHEAPDFHASTLTPSNLPEPGCILFVDDEKMLVQANYALLERRGYEVVACTESHEALEVFRQDPGRFDVVITDQTMPQMTGTELVCELRRIRPDLPIILCTGFSYVIDAEEAEALGIESFLLKPVLEEELVATIHEVLDQR